MRATDAEINFKPWIYQIARNAAIDSYRRNSHAVEVSMDADDGLRASDRTRLVGLDGGPDSALVTKERLTHLQGAFDELSDVHTRVLVMRELEGMSYREIGKRLDLTRPAVESALFRARRRLESEYTELSEGRRCEAMRQTMIRMAAGIHKGAEEHRLARHARRCHDCRRRAREMGIEPLTKLGTLRRKAAALLPIPWLFRRSGDGGTITGLFSTGANAAPLAERAAALVAAAALVGAGGAALGGGVLQGPRDGPGGPSRGRALHGSARGIAARHSRARHGRGARGSAPGVRAEGRSAGGRADSGDRLTEAPASSQAPAGGPAAQRPPARRTRCRSCPAAPPPATPSPTGGRSRRRGSRCPQAAPLPTPKVELPPVNVQVPSVDDVTGGLQNALP